MLAPPVVSVPEPSVTFPPNAPPPLSEPVSRAGSFVNFMGDAAFGMTGLDFETAVRCAIPVLTVVLNNSAMAIEIPHLVVSHDKYGTRDIGGRYADLGRAMGGWSERVERPEDIAGAFGRARKATESGQAALLEFITSQETRFSHRGALR